MKLASLIKISTLLLTTVSTLLISLSALAKTINLYEQPNQAAKIVGTIDPSSGVIPIFTPKGSKWIKIGDPSNGNVGWIKSSDISKGSSTSFSFMQKIITTDHDQPSTYTIQVGQPADIKVDPKMQAIVKKMEAEQKAMQESATQLMQDVIDNINKLYKQQPELLHNNTGMPIIMPIMIVPAATLAHPPVEKDAKKTPAKK